MRTVAALRPGTGAKFMNRWELVLTALDTVAFVLVTTELFGAERLENLRREILSLGWRSADPAEPFKDQRTGKVLPFRTWAIVALVFVLTMTAMWLCLYLIAGALAWGVGTTPMPMTWNELGFFLVVLGIAFLALFFFYGAWFFGHVILPALIELTRRNRIQGMMVATGSMIYLVARVIAAVHGYLVPDATQHFGCRLAVEAPLKDHDVTGTIVIHTQTSGKPKEVRPATLDCQPL